MGRMRTGPLEIAALLAIMLAGCRGEGEGNGAGSAGPAGGGGGAVQTATLTGLYEGGEGERRNQMCVVEREGAGTNFGFVIWGKGDTSCSGSGPARREGDRLRLELDGDESCALEARVEGRRVSLPSDIPEQCHAYYCGPGAQMRGATFDKVAGGEQDAMRARDLADEPLCNN